MDYLPFVRKPFEVQAVQVTTENIAEIATMIGRIRRNERGPYIQVNLKIVPNIPVVYPGYWVTKMGGNIRCYSERVFKQQFVETDPDIQSWVDFLNAKAGNSKSGEVSEVTTT